MPLTYDDSVDNVQNQPGTVLAVTATLASPVTTTVTGTIDAVFSGTVPTSQSNWPAGATTLIGGQPIYINSTATLAVSQSNVPLGNTIVYVTSSTTPTVTTQNPSLTGVALKALNSARRGLTVYNQTSQILYLALGVTATLVNFTLIMDVSGYYEAPFGYNGAVWGIQGAAATGLVYITEVV